MQDDHQNSKQADYGARAIAIRDEPQPAPCRVRHDGWTAERKTAFIDSLTRTGCVRDGISSASAYRCKWDAAFDER